MKKTISIISRLKSLTFSLFLKCITIVLAISLSILLPLLLIACIPLFLLRQFMSKIGPRIKPSLSKMVTTRGSFLASEDLFNNPKCNIVVNCTLKGNLDFNVFQDIIQNRVLDTKLPPTGEILYPELQQCLTTWLGFYFWKKAKNFKLKGHLKLHERCKSDGDRFNDKDIAKIRQELVTKKWDKKKPLWESVIINNYYPSSVTDKQNSHPHTSIHFRFHHSLGDGYSILNLITKYLQDDNQEVSNIIPKLPERGTLSKFLYIMKMPFRVPYEFAQFLLLPFVYLPWRVPFKKQKVGKTMTDLTNQIPMSRLKEIKDHFKVSFSSVLFAVLAGAQRDMLIRKGCRVSDTVPALTLLPIPGHSEKLRNYMTLVLVTLPIGEPDPIKRLDFCFKNYQSLKNSTVPLIFIYAFMLAGSFFTCVGKLIANNQAVTTGLTNFPGGNIQFSIAGHKCIDAMFTSGLQNGCAGTGFCILSYGDNIRISLMANSEIMTKEDLRGMTLLVEKHIDILYQHVT